MTDTTPPTNSDAMVITPDFVGQPADKAARRVSERPGARRAARDRGRHRLLGGARFGRGLRAGAGRAGRAAGGARFSSLIARVGVAAVVVAIVAAAVRLGSGRNLQNLGQLFKDKAFGDLFNREMAAMIAFQQVTADPARMRHVDEVGNARHLHPLFRMFERQAFSELQGRSAALREPGMTTDNPFETMVVLMAGAIEESFFANGGKEAIEKLIRAAAKDQ